MERRTLALVFAAFFLATTVGYAGHQMISNDGSSSYTEDLDLRVDSETQVASTEFDGNYLELRYEDTEKAKFYFKFNDTRDVQQLEGLRQDGTLQTTTKIRSFGNKTYFLYLRYLDNPNQSEDGYMELYRIEEA